MQVGGAVHGASTIHRRRRLNVLLAIAAIVVIAALVVLAGALMTSTGGAENVNPSAGSATLHDDAGNMNP